MDMDRIQKINHLANDLLKQGLAQNREDAVFQAEHVFRNRDTDDYKSIKETMREVEKERKEIRGEKNGVEMDLPAEKIKDILEQNTKFLVKTIKEFQEKINSLENELASLRTKITYQNLPSANEIRVNTVKEAVDVEKEVSVNAVNTNNSNTAKTKGTSRTDNSQVPSNHPRSGDFKEKDVSIEEFFYMGNRKS